MRITVSARNCFDDIWQNFKTCKWKAVFCALTALTGVIIGVVLFKISNYNWWYCNRIDFADKLMFFSFSVFWYCLFSSALLFIFVILCNMLTGTRFLVFAVLFVFCLYVGATCAALFVLSGVWATIYVILIASVEIAGIYLVCFLSLCECACRRTFCEAYRDMRLSFFVAVIAFFAKIILFFIVMKILTSFI